MYTQGCLLADTDVSLSGTTLRAFYVRDEQGRKAIGAAICGGNGLEDESAQANAHMFAAANQMYDALKPLLARVEEIEKASELSLAIYCLTPAGL